MLHVPNSELEPKPRPRCTQIHGVLVSVLETGVLLIGESGTGKSECALELIDRGHALVADDGVELYEHNGLIMGRSNANVSELLEVRGLGIIHASRVFGNASIQVDSTVDLCIELSLDRDIDRLPEATEYRILRRVIPKLILPVDRRRNLGLVVETVVRSFRADGNRLNSLPRHTDLLTFAG